MSSISPLQHCMYLLIRYHWLVLLTLVITVASALFFTLQTMPVYQGTATIQIHLPDQELKDLLEEAFNARRGEKLETELEILKSRSLAAEVVRRLQYQLQIVPAHHMKFLTLAPPFHRQPAILLRQVEVGTVPTPEEYSVAFLPEGAFVIRAAEDGRVLGRGRIGQPFRSPLFSCVLESENAQAGDEVMLRLLPLPEATEQLQRNTTVAVVRDTEIVKITTQAISPELASDMAAALAQEYIAFSHRQKTQETSQALDFIEQQLATAHQSLRTSERALSRFKEKKQFVTLDSEAQANVDRLTQFEITLKRIESSRQEAEHLLRHLQKQGDPPENQAMYTIGGGLGSPVLETLAARLADLQVSRQALRVQYGAKHPRLLQVAQQIAQVKERMFNELSTLIANLRSREATQRRIVGEYEARLGRLPQTELQLANLARQTRIEEEIYAFLLKKQEEMRIVQASTISNTRIIDLAQPRKTPVKPNKRKNLLLAAVLGSMLGLGAAVLLDHFDDSLKTIEEAEHRVGCPLLGIIPEMDSRRQRSPGDAVVSLMGNDSPWHSAAVEGYKSLRTNLRFLANGEERLHKLAITSPQAGDGKTTVAANLALCLGILGHQTLLIDADLRCPRLYQMFGVPRWPGLSNALHGEPWWNDMVHTVGENLSLLPPGEPSPNASELLDSQRLRVLMAEWGKAYDYILFDVPAIIAVTDPVVVGTLCQGVLLVVRAHVTSTKALQRARTLLETARVPIVGTVLNGLRLTRQYGYGYYYHTYTHYAETKKRRHRKGRQRTHGFRQAPPP